MNNGFFISFEGVDGVGKTTQVARLQQYIHHLGIEVVVTREPGGTALGTSLRKLLLHGGDVAARTEALLFAADRAQHVAEVVRPALSRGAVVISDRYVDSSLAYQAGGRELTVDEVRKLSGWATGGLMPGRTYLLDMDPSAAHNRITHSDDRMESEGDGFRRRTRDEFLKLAGDDPTRFLRVDAGESEQDVANRIREDFDNLWSACGGSEKNMPDAK